jgi:RNA polymerase sigma factor (sigma-70 family)
MMNHMIDLNNTTDWSDTRALVASCGPLAASSDSWLIQHFAVKRDERAFAVLLLRHGPMVLNVCRRILGDHHAAEDALQATFLVLARKARSLKNPEQLANWLYGVARRVALDSRARGRRWRLRQDVPLDRQNIRASRFSSGAVDRGVGQSRARCVVGTRVGRDDLACLRNRLGRSLASPSAPARMSTDPFGCE